METSPYLVLQQEFNTHEYDQFIPQGRQAVLHRKVYSPDHFVFGGMFRERPVCNLAAVKNFAAAGMNHNASSMVIH